MRFVPHRPLALLLSLQAMAASSTPPTWVSFRTTIIALTAAPSSAAAASMTATMTGTGRQPLTSSRVVTTEASTRTKPVRTLRMAVEET